MCKSNAGAATTFTFPPVLLAWFSGIFQGHEIMNSHWEEKELGQWIFTQLNEQTFVDLVLVTILLFGPLKGDCNCKLVSYLSYLDKPLFET